MNRARSSGPPGEVPFNAQHVSSAATETAVAPRRVPAESAGRRKIGARIASTATPETNQPSHEIGSQPQPPHRRGPNHSFLPMIGLVLTTVLSLVVQRLWPLTRRVPRRVERQSISQSSSLNSSNSTEQHLETQWDELSRRSPQDSYNDPASELPRGAAERSAPFASHAPEPLPAPRANASVGRAAPQR